MFTDSLLDSKVGLVLAHFRVFPAAKAGIPVFEPMSAPLRVAYFGVLSAPPMGGLFCVMGTVLRGGRF